MRAERGEKTKTALVQAVDLLARRAHGERELRSKLAARGYDAAAIDAAIERLKAEHYLDDEVLCGDLAQAYLEGSKYGYRYIRYKLRERGFAEDVVARSLGAEDEARERAVASTVAARKYGVRGAAPGKVYRFLLSRGFSECVARRTACAADDCET